MATYNMPRTAPTLEGSERPVPSATKASHASPNTSRVEDNLQELSY